MLKETEGSDKKLKRKEEELLQQRKVMRYVVMSTLRQGFVPSGNVLMPMLNCLESCDDGATARHIMAVTLRFAKDVRCLSIEKGRGSGGGRQVEEGLEIEPNRRRQEKEKERE